MGYAPRQYLSSPLSSPKYRIWDTPYARNIDLLRVSIYPSSPAAADIGHEILRHVSIYLAPFPARNIGYGICPLRGSIFPIRPYGRRHRIWDFAPCPCLSIHFSNPEIWIWDRPPARRGCGMCPLRPPDPSEIAPRQYLSIPFPNPKYGIWDLTPARQCLSIPFSRRYRMWDIAPRQFFRTFRLFGFLLHFSELVGIFRLFGFFATF